MFGKLWKKCVNYETISYLVCGVLTTAVDFVSYTAFRKMSMGVGAVSYTHLSWVGAGAGIAYCQFCNLRQLLHEFFLIDDRCV